MIFFTCTKHPYLWCTKIPTPCLHFPLPIPIEMCPPSGSHNSLLPPSVNIENCTQTLCFSHELLDSIFGVHVLFLFAAAGRFPITIVTASNFIPAAAAFFVVSWYVGVSVVVGFVDEFVVVVSLSWILSGHVACAKMYVGTSRQATLSLPRPPPGMIA